MSTLSAYLPQDRRRALACDETLPDRAFGSVLFADLSGFTAITEQLTRELGHRRGAEELSQRLEAVYTALITQIEHYGGSVISFAGDAMLCWFADGEWPMANGAGSQPLAIRYVPSAIRCAAALQAAMQQFPQLALKVAVATGPVRRLVVGNPDQQLFDVLAGDTLVRMAIGERLARKGEVVVDEATAQSTAQHFAQWRTAETGERFAVVNQLRVNSEELRVESAPTQPAQLLTFDSQRLTAFILPAVYARETSGQGAFLTEFRPCAVLFVRFAGIDYNAAAAQTHLDTLTRDLQAVATRYDGTLLQLTIGDKGSYAYLNFGALSAHEDDARRAIKAALALRQMVTWPLQMGIAQGVMRVGAYGGPTRRTYGALGDDVNLAARLMMTAAAGEIVVSGRMHASTLKAFEFAPRPPLPLKGKAGLLPAFAVLGERQPHAIRLQEPQYALPMVGRAQELQVIHEKLDWAAQGHAQVIGIMAEAGLGKSRLVAEAIRLAHQKGFVGYGGACQSDGIHTPYLAWKPIWSAFFGLNATVPFAEQVRILSGAIAHYAPTRTPTLPLLNIVLDLDLPENDFTRSLEPQHRQRVLTALCADCLRAATHTQPVLVVIEDLHWVDVLSLDLLAALVQALADCRLCFVLAYRPPPMAHLPALGLEALPGFTHIELTELHPAEVEQAIRAKLAQLYAHSAPTTMVPAPLMSKLMARAQGNPFYLEELLNYLHDRGLDPRDPAALEQIELPDSLHTLILSRIDQLSEHEKNTLRVASIIGRLFRTQWLIGYYPALGPLPQVQAGLEALTALDITAQEAPEPELTYLFKHIITHEVTYESLPFATRAQLHEQLARFLEARFAETHAQEALPLETLAFHYGRSQNAPKKREYWRKAGEAAQKNFANAAALNFYDQLLPLLPTEAEQIEIQLKRATVLEVMGQFEETEAVLNTALALAQGKHLTLECEALRAKSALATRLGRLPEALTLGEAALTLARTLQQPPLIIASVRAVGMVNRYLGHYAQSQQFYLEGLALARQQNDPENMARCLNSLGLLASHGQQYAAALDYFEQGLQLYRALNSRWGMGNSLTSLGWNAFLRGDYAGAWEYTVQCLEIFESLGDTWFTANARLNLGHIAAAQHNPALSWRYYRAALPVVFGQQALSATLEALAGAARLLAAEQQFERAAEVLGLALRHPATTVEVEPVAAPTLTQLRAQFSPAELEAALARGAARPLAEVVAEILNG